MVAVIIGREFAVTALRSLAYARGVVMPASPLGQDQDGGAGGGDPRADSGARPDAGDCYLIGQAALWVVVVTALVSARRLLPALQRHPQPARRASSRCTREHRDVGPQSRVAVTIYAVTRLRRCCVLRYFAARRSRRSRTASRARVIRVSAIVALDRDHDRFAERRERHAGDADDRDTGPARAPGAMPCSLPRSISMKSPARHVAAVLRCRTTTWPIEREVGLARRLVAIGAGRHDRRDERLEIVALRRRRAADMLERGDRGRFVDGDDADPAAGAGALAQRRRPRRCRSDSRAGRRYCWPSCTPAPVPPFDDQQVARCRSRCAPIASCAPMIRSGLPARRVERRRRRARHRELRSGDIDCWRPLRGAGHGRGEQRTPQPVRTRRHRMRQPPEGLTSAAASSARRSASAPAADTRSARTPAPAVRNREAPRLPASFSRATRRGGSTPRRGRCTPGRP